MGYDVVFYHQWLDAHPLHRSHSEAEAAVEPRALIRFASGFVRRCAPVGRPVLITDDAARAGDLPGVVVEERPVGDPASLQLDRTRAYRDYLARRIGGERQAIFLDTDALAIRELAPLFEREFDVALTYLASARQRPVQALDRWGLPNDGRPSVINFGVMAARATPAAVAFFDAALARYAGIIAEGEAFLTGPRNSFRLEGDQGERRYRIPDVRTWGGGQFALTSLLSATLFGGTSETCEVAGARILLLPSTIWNFSPKAQLDRAELKDRYILHLKGNRKVWLEGVAGWFGVEG